MTFLFKSCTTTKLAAYKYAQCSSPLPPLKPHTRTHQADQSSETNKNSTQLNTRAVNAYCRCFTSPTMFLLFSLLRLYDATRGRRLVIGSSTMVLIAYFVTLSPQNCQHLLAPHYHLSMKPAPQGNHFLLYQDTRRHHRCRKNYQSSSSSA